MIGNGSGMAIMVLTFLYGLKENGEFGHIIPLFRQDALRTKKLPRFKQGSDENLLLLDDGVAADEGQFLGFAGDNIVNAQNSIGQPYNAENPEDDAENPADQSDATQDPSQNPGNDTDDAQDDALVYMELREFGILGKEQGNEPQNADVAENAQQLVAFNIFRAAFSSAVLGAVNQFPQIVFIHFQSLFSIIGYGEANPHLFYIIIRFLKMSSEISCSLSPCVSQGQQNGGRNQQPQHDTGTEQNGKQRFHKNYLRQKISTKSVTPIERKWIAVCSRHFERIFVYKLDTK